MHRIVIAGRLVLALAALAVVAPARAAAQAPAPPPADSAALPVVRVAGPSVVAFWHVPASDAELDADPALASLLDEHQYWWAETRDSLEAMGVAALDRPGRRFVVEEPGRRWVFAAAPDSAATGHLVVVPGRAPRVLYGRHFPNEVAEAAREVAREVAGER